MALFFIVPVWPGKLRPLSKLLQPNFFLNSLKRNSFHRMAFNGLDFYPAFLTLMSIWSLNIKSWPRKHSWF